MRIELSWPCPCAESDQQKLNLCVWCSESQWSRIERRGEDEHTNDDRHCPGRISPWRVPGRHSHCHNHHISIHDQGNVTQHLINIALRFHGFCRAGLERVDAEANSVTRVAGEPDSCLAACGSGCGGTLMSGLKRMSLSVTSP